MAAAVAAGATPLYIITGASRGFGRALALAAAADALTHGHASPAFVLLARDAAGLAATGAAVASAAPAARVATVAADLGDLPSLDATWDAAEAAASSLLRGLDAASATLFNNAGSVGHIGPIAARRGGGGNAPLTLADLRANVDLNVTSSAWATVRFLRWAPLHAPAATTTVVNVSSLAAVQPTQSLAVYCQGKAARDMFHAVVAAEMGAATATTTRVLNYAPGPLETDMHRDLMAAPGLHTPLRTAFAAMHADGTVLTADMSAAVCLRVLREGAFASGAHVDYYDVAAKSPAAAHAVTHPAAGVGVVEAAAAAVDDPLIVASRRE